MSKKVTRLYDNLKPENYKLDIHIDPTGRKFSGKVIIRAKKTGRPSKRITLHQKNLTITSATIVKHDKKLDNIVEISRMNTQKSYDEVRLHSQSTLYPGEYTITLHFTGKITNPMNGLYPCHFKHEGKDKILLATQFESHHAREVFPCIDEPEAKATFDLSITTPNESSQTTLANTPILSEVISPDNQTKQITFETTPIMSTYLLAFVHGEIGHKQAKTQRGTFVGAYATPDNVKFVDFALDTAVKCLEFYEEYFDIAFPLPKSDMIALPDFASGAMENWGLITYREQCMLVDPKNTSIGTKQYVAMVVAHELAHQWFGNLVTMKWWTDLWLNEGFASWIEYLAIDHIFPEWNMWTQFIADEQQPALKLDSINNTHAIEVEINHPDEIRTVFDTISYNKGASVIHMLYGYLGAKDFRNGLRAYLKKHAYSNTVTNDLWASLEEVSGKPVKSFMHAWTSLPGFPLLKVERKAGQLHLRQDRLFMVPPKDQSRSKWPIPLLANSKLPNGIDHLEHKELALDTNKTIKFNQHQNGFYRTIYSSELVAELADKMHDLQPLDKLGIIADSFEASKAGYSSVTDGLQLLKHCHDDESSPLWDIIANNIGEIRRVMDDDSVREAIKPFVRDLISTQLKRLGTNEKKSDSYFDKLLRPTILALASSADEQSIIDWCEQLFAKAKHVSDIHPDIRSVVFSTVARHGDKTTYAQLLKFHNNSDSSEERLTLSAALTSFEQPELTAKSLAMVNSQDVRRQDAMYWIAYSFMNRHAKQATWQWVKENWQWLDKELGSDLSFYRMPIYVARSFSNNEFKDEYKAFFVTKSTPSLERSIKQGLEMLEWQINWRQKDLANVIQFLTQAKS
ncbi:M1 family metallopeptidase [Candidatus Saccharibacteria bacterium]|nr:M1 family metallopeptidase [Candidatus Saccharibacteria bacterium]